MSSSLSWQKSMIKDKKTINLIKQALRAATLKWHIRNETKQGARVYIKEGEFKNGKPKKRVYYKCKICRGNFKTGDVQVDHIDEIGKFTGDWNDYIERMFCDISNLQVLCKDCHKKKTKKAR